MRKSKREFLASRIGIVICHTVFGTWANEFDDGLDVKIDEKLCDGKVKCVVTVYRNEEKREG